MKCFTCNELIPEESDTCIHCGWSYKEEEGDTEDENAKAACPGCLEVFPPDAHYCPKCGYTVGQYTKYLPFEMGMGALNYKKDSPKRRNENTVTSRIVGFIGYAILSFLIWFIIYVLRHKNDY